MPEDLPVDTPTMRRLSKHAARLMTALKRAAETDRPHDNFVSTECERPCSRQLSSAAVSLSPTNISYSPRRPRTHDPSLLSSEVLLQLIDSEGYKTQLI